jgi:hypothetical protein
MLSKIIDVKCRCGFLLFRYQKVGRGRLIKCYFSRIVKDYGGIISLDAKKGSFVFCPSCQEKIGLVFGIKGTRAIKLNQGQIMPVRL